MGQITEVLTLQDRFSNTYQKYIKYMQQSTKQTQGFNSVLQQNTKTNLAFSNSLSNITRRLALLGTAYLSFTGIKNQISKGFNEVKLTDTMTGLFKGNETLGKAATDWSFKIANNLGYATSEIVDASQKFLKMVDNGSQLTNITNLADKFSKFNPKLNINEVANAIQQAYNKQDSRSLVQALDINEGVARKFNLQEAFQSGDVNKFLDALNKVSDAMGMTDKEYQKLLKSPTHQWSKFVNTFQNSFTRAAKAFTTAFAPAFEKFNIWLSGTKGTTFFELLSATFYKAGKLAEYLVDVLAKNHVMILKVTGALVGFFVVMKAIKGSIVIVQTLTKAFKSLRLVMLSLNAANPIGLIAIAVVGLIVAIAKLQQHMASLRNETITMFESITGVLFSLGAGVINVFKMVADLVLGTISIILNASGSLANFLGNIFVDPIASILNLFRDLGNVINDTFIKIASTIDTFTGNMTNLTKLFKDGKAGWNSFMDKAVDKFGNGKYKKIAKNDFDLQTGFSAVNYDDAYNKGTDFAKKFGSFFDDFHALGKDLFSAKDNDLAQLLDTLGNPLKIDSIAKPVKTKSADMSIEELRSLNDIGVKGVRANDTQSYIDNHPNIYINVKSDLSKKEDIDKLSKTIADYVSIKQSGMSHAGPNRKN